jgi:hypothetical protein
LVIIANGPSKNLNGTNILYIMQAGNFSDKQDSGAVMENDQSQGPFDYNPFVNHVIVVPALIRYNVGGNVTTQDNDGSITMGQPF